MEIEQSDDQEQHHLLSDELKYNIIFLKRTGLNNNAIAKAIHETHGRCVHPSTVKRICEKFYKTQDISNLWNPEGRPRLLTEEEPLVNLAKKCKCKKTQKVQKIIFKQNIEYFPAVFMFQDYM